MEISDYMEQHRYCNQNNIVNGIPLNPTLREDFDSTPNEYREHLEVQDWWNKPYISTCSWDDLNEDFGSYRKRMAGYGYGDESMDSEAVFVERKGQEKERWFNAWPSGVRYEVLCLNGGAWDRPTSLAMVETLDSAIVIATNYEPVDYGVF